MKKYSMIILVLAVAPLLGKKIEDKKLFFNSEVDYPSTWKLGSSQVDCCMAQQGGCTVSVEANAKYIFDYGQHKKHNITPCWATCAEKIEVTVHEPDGDKPAILNEMKESLEATKGYIEEAGKVGGEVGERVGAVAEAAGVEGATEGTGKVAGEFVGVFSGAGSGAGNAIQVECFENTFTLRKVPVGDNYSYIVEPS